MLQRLLPVVTLILIAATSGCRMYGGHGSEAASYEAIQTAVDRYQARAERMRGDHRLLAEAASTEPRLVPLVSELAALVEAQEATLELHTRTASSVSVSSSYRSLRTALGSILSEQQVIDDGYARVLAAVANAPELGRDDLARYSVVPAYFARIEASLEQLPLRDALRQN